MKKWRGFLIIGIVLVWFQLLILRGLSYGRNSYSYSYTNPYQHLYPRDTFLSTLQLFSLGIIGALFIYTALQRRKQNNVLAASMGAKAQQYTWTPATWKDYRWAGGQWLDIGLTNGSGAYSLILSVSAADWDWIMAGILPNGTGVYDGLAARYHSDRPWAAQPGLSWEIPDIEITMNQMLFVREISWRGKARIAPPHNGNYQRLHNICSDICEMMEKANRGEGKVYITCN